MASDILDIVHRFSYIVDKAPLEGVLKNIQEQATSLGVVTRRMVELKQQLEAAGTTGNDAFRNQIQKSIDSATRSQAVYTQSIMASISSNKKLNDEFIKETSLIGGLTIRMNELKEARLNTFDTGEIAGYNVEINALKASIANLMAIGTKVNISAQIPQENGNVLASTATPAAVSAVGALGMVSPPVEALGIIQQLNQQVSELNQKKLLAGSAAEIAPINRQLELVKKQLDEVSNAGVQSGGALSSIFQRITTGFGVAIGFQALGAVEGAITDFVGDGTKMAEQLEGISNAFQRLDSPGLLDNLRTATKGTVSDLNLMREAVEYDQLGLPVDKLALALQFATQRAAETGESVDKLVKDIVDGIGRQSTKILDNLGLSQNRVRDEYKRVGDFGVAAFNIISEEIAKGSDELDTYAQRQARLAAGYDNIKASAGGLFEFIKGLGIGFLETVGNNIAHPGNPTNAQPLAEAIDQPYEDQKNSFRNNLITDEANKKYEQNFKEYLDGIDKLDFDSRKTRLDGATETYQKLLAMGKLSFNQSSDDYKVYTSSVTRAYVDFQKNFLRSGTKMTTGQLLGLSPDNLKTANKGDLQALLKQVQDARNDLPVSDISGKAALNGPQTTLEALLKSYGPDKTNDNLVKQQDALADRLRESIVQLSREGLDLALKSSVQTSGIIRQQVEEERDAALERVKIEEDAAVRKGTQTVDTEFLFQEQRKSINEKYDNEYLLRNKDFLEKLDKQQAGFNVNLGQAELASDEQSNSLPGSSSIGGYAGISADKKNLQDAQAEKQYNDLLKEADTFVRQRQSLLDEADQKLADKDSEDNRAAAEKAVQALNAANDNISNVYGDFYEKADLNNKTFHNDLIENETKYYRDREKINKDNADASESNISAQHINTRQKALLQNPFQMDRSLQEDTLQQQIDNAPGDRNNIIDDKSTAQQALANITASPGATSEQVTAAQKQVDDLTNQLEELDEKTKQAQNSLKKLTDEGTLNKGGGHDLFSGGAKQDVDDTIDLYDKLGKAVQEVYNQMASAKQAQLSKELDYNKQAIDEAQILADRGNVGQLKLAEDRENKLEAQQRSSAQKQQEINAGLTLSYALLAVLKAIVEYGPIAGAIAGVAALTAGYAFVQSFNTDITAADGAIDLQGPGTTKSDSIRARLSRGESVMTAEATSMYKPILEQMQALTYDPSSTALYSPGYFGGQATKKTNDYSKMEAKLDGVIAAVSNIGVNAHQNINANGVSQMVEIAAAKTKRRWQGR